MKKYISEKKNRFLTFPKNVMSFEKRKFFGHGKFFEQNSVSSSQWIKCQKMIGIMKKDTCEICLKKGANFFLENSEIGLHSKH